MTRPRASETILVVEDSDDEYDALVRALSRDRHLTISLHRYKDGQQALDYLFHRGLYKDAEKGVLPGIILLDLNVPGIDSRKVLAELKNDDRLRRIPVIVMTNSDAERDIEECYRLGANTYIRKPFDWSDFLNSIQHLKKYWFEIAILPKG